MEPLSIKYGFIINVGVTTITTSTFLLFKIKILEKKTFVFFSLK